MVTDFCNLMSLGWITGQHLAPLPHREHKELHSDRVGREEVGMSSNRPELADIRECLEAPQDHKNLLYLTDSEATLQPINKWIGGGAKLTLVRSPDGDVLKTIIIKLQRRVKTVTSTLLIKDKDHGRDLLNEEVDIRVEMGRLKEES